jgi:membrane protease YdiL (CAAX protease family)
MTGRQTALVLHAALLVGALFFIVPALTGWDPRAGYLLSLTLYWLCFCLPVIGLYALPGDDGRLFTEKLPWRDWWLLPALVAQVGVVAILVFVPNTALLTTLGMWLALLFALINGPLEEIAWRGGFINAFRDRPRLGFWLGWGMFVAFHVPLTLSIGVVFEGGGWTLLAGAAGLGLFWNWIAWRTGSVFYTSLAHGLTNVFLFWILFERNGWARWALET